MKKEPQLKYSCNQPAMRNVLLRHIMAAHRNRFVDPADEK